jgi:hypothetical protein
MRAAPGETENAELAEFAVTGPAPHPARRVNPEIRSKESSRKRCPNGRKAAAFAPGSGSSLVIWTIRSKISVVKQWQ